MIFLNRYKISIIVPTFNLEDKIECAFESIKNQTLSFDNIEIIFVDDNSTDHTFDIITELSEKYKNVSVFKTDSNTGYAGKPRNIGLEHATADYVLFLDGDDKLLRNACERLYDSIASTDIDIAIGGQINVFDGIHQHNPPLNYGEGRLLKDMKTSEVLDIQPAISAKLFKRKLLIDNDIRFPEGISGEDLVFLMETLLNSKKIITLNNFYVYYRILSNNSVTFDISEKYLKGLVKAYTLVCDLYDKFEVQLQVQEKVIYQHIRFFTSQTIRTNVSSNKTMLHDLFNSDLFKNLADKEVFKNNKYYKQYFENMSKGKYDNFKLLTIISNNFLKEDESNLKILNEKLYSANLTLNDKYKSLYRENIVLEKNNENLNEENIELNKKYEYASSANSKLTNDKSKLEEELKDVKFNMNIINDENIYLKKDNVKIYEKCDILKKENDKVKSSILWKLKNIF